MKKDYYSLIEENKIKIAVIGLGYVGLPLAIEFGKRYDTTGFDINIDRVNELNDKFDKTKEISYDNFISSKYLSITNTENLLKTIDTELSSAEIQTQIYEIGKKHNFVNLRDYFRLVYQVLLGQEEGPRLGSFIKLYGIKKTCKLLEDALKQ